MDLLHIETADGTKMSVATEHAGFMADLLSPGGLDMHVVGQDHVAETVETASDVTAIRVTALTRGASNLAIAHS